jgi:hypothetical protein
MTEKPKNSDKPKDPPYAGGEDEEGNKSPSQIEEPPVDESDEGTLNAHTPRHTAHQAS